MSIFVLLIELFASLEHIELSPLDGSPLASLGVLARLVSDLDILVILPILMGLNPASVLDLVVADLSHNEDNSSHFEAFASEELKSISDASYSQMFDVKP